MTDIIDLANDVQDQLNSDAEARVRSKVAPEAHPDFNGCDCVDCGDGMHPVRLAARRVRCTECQSILERRAK